MCAIANRRRLRRLLLRLGVVVALTFAASAVAPGAAGADYTVRQCIPGSQGYSEAAWTPFGSTGFSVWGFNECASGSLYGLRLDTYHAPQGGTGWTGNGSGLAWRFTAPGGTTFASASASLHYGDNGGYAAAYYSDGSPGFAVPDGGGGNPNLFTTASVSNAHIFEVRLQCFANPNCHSDWSYVWTTNFIAGVRDQSAPGITASGSLLGGGWIRDRRRRGSAGDGGLCQRLPLAERGLLPAQLRGWLYPPEAVPKLVHTGLGNQYREGHWVGRRSEYGQDLRDRRGRKRLRLCGPDGNG
jgi:hypothetical protein